MPDEARRIDDKLQELGTVVTRIDTKLDVVITAQNDHEKRLRVLEAWRWTQLGAAVAASSTIATIAARVLGPHT